jgi:hypothetical protein
MSFLEGVCYWGVVGFLLCQRVLLRLVYFVSVLNCVYSVSTAAVLDGLFFGCIHSPGNVEAGF